MSPPQPIFLENDYVAWCKKSSLGLSRIQNQRGLSKESPQGLAKLQPLWIG